MNSSRSSHLRFVGVAKQRRSQQDVVDLKPPVGRDRRDGLRYASDPSDAGAAVDRATSSCGQAARAAARDRTLRRVIDAMLYLLTTGCQWRLLPKEFPPYTTVQRFFYGWRDDGTGGGSIIICCWLPARPRVARPARPRGDRQPVGRDDRGRRPAGLRRGQEGKGQEAPYPDRYQWVAGCGDRAPGRPAGRDGGAAAGLHPQTQISLSASAGGPGDR